MDLPTLWTIPCLQRNGWHKNGLTCMDSVLGYSHHAMASAARPEGKLMLAQDGQWHGQTMRWTRSKHNNLLFAPSGVWSVTL